LDGLGEKSLSTSVLFYGVVYYTTFTPAFGDPGDVCFLGKELASCTLKYKTGYAALDLDHDGIISPIGDRYTSVGEEENYYSFRGYHFLHWRKNDGLRWHR
jgi:hypothetical protein